MNRKLLQLEKARKIFSKKSVLVFSMDIDWASEYIIKETLNYFERQEIPLTVFLTHKSPVLDNAMKRKVIKCGIHPNFMTDSSQGKNYEEVMDYCRELLPDARGFRAHRYFDVNDTVDKLYDRGIMYESNICTFLDTIPPFLHRSGMIGFPVFFEDGGYLFQNGSLEYNDIKKRLHEPGLKVINFHPVHFVINTPYFSYTRKIKDRLTRKEFSHLDEQTLEKLCFEGRGIATFIKEMIEDVKENHLETTFMDDVYEWMMNL